MWEAILAAFPTIAGWINLIIGFFQARAKAQDDQNTAVDQAVSQHNNDGVQSVNDMNSSDQQNAEIDKEIEAIDNPTPVVVVQPKDQK